MRVVSSESLAKGRFEGARYGPRTISRILDDEPPGVPHKFTNQGPGDGRLICIHASPTIATEFLE